MIYISSDLHLNHDKPFIYAVRGYSSVEEMNKDLITKFNNTVTDDDEEVAKFKEFYRMDVIHDELSDYVLRHPGQRKVN